MAVDANVDTVSELLARAVDVCHAVRGIHSLGYTDRCDTDFARLLEGLTHSVKRVENEEGEYEKSLIKFACVQIGNDLAVHVNRVLNAFSDSIDVAGFRKLWPLDDVTALNVRLREVLHQCQDAFPSSHELCLPLLADLQLTGRELEPEETETKSSIGSTEPVAHDDAGKSPGQIPVIPRPPRLAPVGLINDFILESLSYKSMHDRESQVTEAHSKTLDWIFDNSPIHQSLRQNFRDSFVSWLSSTELGHIYWITGKPGSGKSTLVRYLSQHPVALYHLRRWGGKKRVNTAGFFFWTSGSRQQRSQTGLLRYLLHQLLSSDPELIEKAFPDLWSRLRQMTTKERVNFALEWTVQDLQAAFHSLLDAALHSVNICLFIDGLDEFDGDHVQIINFFKDLTSRYDGKSLKLCLSSRPWDVFEKAFETSVPNTKLQDLSYDDILAVERMLVTFQKNSKFEVLETTLKELPTDLDDLFEKLLFNDQTSSEIMQTATLFQLMHAREIVADFIKDESSNSLTVWELAFALFKEDDVMALDREVVEASDEEIQRRCGTTVQYIQARFARLLNVHVAKPMGNMRVPKFQDRHANVASLITTSKVIYIHRTVRDWLMDGGAGKRLEALQSPDFDPHIRLQRSYVLRLKHPLEEIEHHRRLDEWYPDIALAMTHARYIVNDAQGLQRKFLNEMDKALSWLWLEKPSDPYDHWAKSTFGAYEVRMKAPPIHRPFLCLATKFGLTTYVCQEVEDLTREEQAVEEEQEDGSTPLLSYATEFLCSRNKTIFPVSSPKLVHWLLNNPSRINPGPNHKYNHFITHQSITPWLAVLRHLRDAKRREWIEYYDINPKGTSRWTEIVRELVQFSDVSAVISKDMWDPEITALGVMEMLEETYGSAEVQRIRVLMEKKMVQ
ncbi:hypothetical protein FOC1_g10004704 [Fusarium oxysporum f. sp. cubense race 1]|uniref:Uncharacterized protein n=1 Tax=Fusarium oxysporum f. sp. cubense (strain race 1) TaxID=1229664 RepID=N4UE57_FUSC1|nr:hypothetical protein FOC1_g10004704 [Fusarium oxysporum f. sp. cubense race 1]